MSFVFPGAEDVLASFEELQIMLIKDDLPTLLRPKNAYSGLSGLGQPLNEGLLITYFAD